MSWHALGSEFPHLDLFVSSSMLAIPTLLFIIESEFHIHA